MTQRKFRDGQRVYVNAKARGDSYFLFKKGVITGYTNGCYDVEFYLPGNGRRELRRLNPTKLTKVIR